MGKGLRGGIIVGVAVLAAAIVYSTLYFQRGLIRFDADGLSIILILVWAAVVAVLLVVLWQRILVRAEYLRNFYLSDTTVFNFELGAQALDDAVPGRDAQALVAYIRASLPRITYEAAPLDPPEGFDPAFCVTTNRFAQGKSGEEWRGTLKRVQANADGKRTFTELATFNSAQELEKALAKAGVLA